MEGKEENVLKLLIEGRRTDELRRVLDFLGGKK